MRKIFVAGLAALSCAAAATAEVVNVEFEFTPYVGDPAVEDMVRTVSGTASVFLNGVLYAEQEVGEEELPVMFDERQIAPAVWLPTESCGPALRKGRNTIRVEFTPADGKATYHAQLRWASVTDESTEESAEGSYSATNQVDNGFEEKEAAGPVTFERAFQADFAADQPWHHYPAVTSLDETDRQALAALVAERVGAFLPDFAGLYAILEANEEVEVAEVREAKCLDQAYAAGVRIASVPAEEMEFVTTGNPEVLIRARGESLFFPADVTAFERIEDEDMQMCAGFALSVVYPPRLVAVRSPSGAWLIAY